MAFIELTVRGGELRHRLKFFSKTVTKGPNTGTNTESWTEEFCSVWGMMTPQGDRKAFAADRFITEKIDLVTIRYRRGINTTMQCEFNGRRFEVVDVFDVQERRIKMLITLREIQQS